MVKLAALRKRVHVIRVLIQLSLVGSREFEFPAEKFLLHFVEGLAPIQTNAIPTGLDFVQVLQVLRPVRFPRHLSGFRIRFRQQSFPLSSLIRCRLGL